jgi:heme-degrading monooxygenase HmoA
MTTAGYRVLFMLRVRADAGEEFLAAYERIRWDAARTEGHLGDQLCRSTGDPDQWLITSEWRSAEDFLDWERTPGHRDLAAPMMALVTERQSLRYDVLRETRLPDGDGR